MTVSIDIAAVHPRMGSPELPWPARKTAQAAGWDCVAAIDEPLELRPGRLVKVPLGFALGLPNGWEAQVRPRSGLAAKGIIMPNSPGTVDADYRGEVSALLYCLIQEREPGAPPYHFEPDSYAMKRGSNGAITRAEITRIAMVPSGLQESIVIQRGDRICQLVIAPVPEVSWRPVLRADLSPTARGEGGFGSTGATG